MVGSITHNVNKKVPRETYGIEAEATGTGSMYSSTSTMQWPLEVLA
jgi:hypothetical protein